MNFDRNTKLSKSTSDAITRTLATLLFFEHLSNNWPKAIKFTDKIRDETSITEPASGILEEGFSIWPPICLVLRSGVDVVIVPRIKQWITEHEKGRLRSIMAANTRYWLSKTSNQNKDTKVKQAWVQSHWSTWTSLRKTNWIYNTNPIRICLFYFFL